MTGLPAAADHQAAGGDSAALRELLSFIDVERIDRDLFRAANRPGQGRTQLFGGLIAAQAVRAAQLTAPDDRPIHSLHSYFLRPGRIGRPVVLRVTRLRDGRSFTTREVTALQDGEAIYTVVASFHGLEEGPEQSSPIASDIEVPTAGAVLPQAPNVVQAPFDIVELVSLRGPWRSGEVAFRGLGRPRGGTVDDPATSACLLAYVSDINTAFSVCRAVGLDPARSMVASLDHSLWFHRPVRWDGWLLVELRPMANASARGLVVGTVHSLDGQQVASLTQEALYRPLREP